MRWSFSGEVSAPAACAAGLFNVAKKYSKYRKYRKYTLIDDGWKYSKITLQCSKIMIVSMNSIKAPNICYALVLSVSPLHTR